MTGSASATPAVEDTAVEAVGTAPQGVELSKDELDRLGEALGRAGLVRGQEWDSLDVACVLTVIEHELGLWFPQGVRPGLLRGLDQVVAALGRAGARRAPGVGLSLDLGGGPGRLSTDELVRERRQLEYRLALAAPTARVAVSRGRQLSVLALADSVGELPLSGEALEILAPGGRPGPAMPGTPMAGHPSVPPPPPALRESGAGEIAEQVGQAFNEFVTGQGGEVWLPGSPVIEVAELRALGYYDAHPEQIVHLSAELALVPAGCLPAYPWLMRADGPRMGTHDQTVFRRELRYDSVGRLPAFTQRELLWRTAAEADAELADQVVELITGLAESLGLSYRWERADDPFYLPVGAEGSGKRELRVRTAGGEIAVASVNRHGDHFVRRGYGQTGEVTGCAGVGLERFVLAAVEARAARGGR